jgi:hypothetical protein
LKSQGKNFKGKIRNGEDWKSEGKFKNCYGKNSAHSNFSNSNIPITKKEEMDRMESLNEKIFLKNEDIKIDEVANSQKISEIQFHTKENFSLRGKIRKVEIENSEVEQLSLDDNYTLQKRYDSSPERRKPVRRRIVRGDRRSYDLRNGDFDRSFSGADSVDGYQERSRRRRFGKRGKPKDACCQLI